MIATATPTEETTTNTYGLCQCGCGERTRLAPWTDKAKGWIKGQPIRFVNGHNRRGQHVDGAAFAIERAIQAELDLEVDDARLERRNWERAIDRSLHAIRDYVHDNQMIVWQPGAGGQHGASAFDVQLTTNTSCTCSRFKLRDRCEHIEFVKHLEAAGMEPGTDTPVSARQIEESEDHAA